MKTEFKIMKIRPAHYNGTIFESDIDFSEASLFSVDIGIVTALDMVPGDTVRVGAKVFINNSDYEYIHIYMCSDMLTDFVEKYGVTKITSHIRAKLKLVYAVYESNDCSIEPVKKEITAYKLIEIIEGG